MADLIMSDSAHIVTKAGKPEAHTMARITTLILNNQVF